MKATSFVKYVFLKERLAQIAPTICQWRWFAAVGLRCFIGRRGHARLISLRLSLLGSTAGTQPGRARITECCTSPLKFLLSSLAPLYTNIHGELGHQVAHTVSTMWAPDTLPDGTAGMRIGPETAARPQHRRAGNKAAAL